MTGYYILVVVLAIAIAFSLSVTVLFNVTEVIVNGATASRYSQSDIAASSGIKAKDNLVRMNTQKIREKMLEELLYVDDIAITKKFPDKVLIEVTPSIDIAYVECIGGYMIISEGWRITGHADAPDNKELMVINGFEAKSNEEKTVMTSEDNDKDQALKEILNEIKKQNIRNIVSIDISDKYDIVINYDNRIKIKIEKPNDIEYKLKYAYKIITEELRENKSGYLIYRNSLGYSYVSDEEYNRINHNTNNTYSSGDAPALTDPSVTGNAVTDTTQTTEVSESITSMVQTTVVTQ
jgi:cell division protein FtsQ